MDSPASESAKLKGKYHLQDPSVDGTVIIRSVLKKQGVRKWTALTSLRMHLSGRVLWTR